MHYKTYLNVIDKDNFKNFEIKTNFNNNNSITVNVKYFDNNNDNNKCKWKLHKITNILMEFVNKCQFANDLGCQELPSCQLFTINNVTDAKYRLDVEMISIDQTIKGFHIFESIFKHF